MTKIIKQEKQDTSAIQDFENKEIINFSEKFVIVVNDAKTKIADGVNATILLTNWNNMHLFYLRYPNLSDTSDKFNLSWSHICELIKIEDNDERSFYENETINSQEINIGLHGSISPNEL